MGDGLAASMSFKNEYGVSVVRFNGSYGYPNLWELAVLHNGKLCYDTDITDDVMGHLSEERVTEVMEEVQSLNL